MSTTVSATDPTALRARLDRAREAAGAAGVDAMLMAPGSDLRYLIGGSGSSFERLTCLVLRTDAPPVLVVPKLEAPGYAAVPTGELGVEIATWVDDEDPYGIVSGLLGTASRVAVGDVMPALHVLGLRGALPGTDQVLAGPIVRELRMRKDDTEVEGMRRAGAAVARVRA